MGQTKLKVTLQCIYVFLTIICLHGQQGDSHCDILPICIILSHRKQNIQDGEEKDGSLHEGVVPSCVRDQKNQKFFFPSSVTAGKIKLAFVTKK